MKPMYLFALTLTACMLSGCAWLQEKNRIEPAPISPFLEKKELMTRREATFPFHYFYLKENAGTYENVYIAPVNTQYLRKNTDWAKLDQDLAKKLGSDIQELAHFAREEFISEFRQIKGPNVLQVVNTPDKEKTLKVELALISIVPTKAELNLLGTAANFVLPGIGVIAGNAAAGSITMECIIRDTKTNEIIAMYANTERDQRAILNLAGMRWFTSAQNNIKKQAFHTANVFSGKDYTYTYRRLIKLIEL